MGARHATLGRSVARSWMIRRRKSGGREGGLDCWEKARGRCGVWQVALGSSSRVWLRIPVERGDALLFSLERLSERARCENAETLRNLRRLLGRAPSSGRFLSFARFGMLSGGARQDNAVTLVACTGRRVERGAEWASKRVALGNCAAVLRGFKCGPQKRAVAPSGMLRQRGRGVKR